MTAGGRRGPDRDGQNAPVSIARSWHVEMRRRRRDELGRWPFTVGICTALAIAIGSATLIRHARHDGLEWMTVALIAVAVLPWVIDLLVVQVPPWLFAPAVIGPVAVIHDPTRFDPAPSLLAVLALDMGLWLGAASIPIVLAAAAVVLLPIPEASTDAGWLIRPLVAMVFAWLVGLVLRSQAQRVSHLRRQWTTSTSTVLSVDLPALETAIASAREAVRTGDSNAATHHLDDVERVLNRLACRMQREESDLGYAERGRDESVKDGS